MKKVLYDAKPKKNSVQTKKRNKKVCRVTKRPIYHIVWRDAFSEIDEWHTTESITDEDYICETVGYLIAENSKSNYYTVASTITAEDTFCAIINIPKSMVIKKTKINPESV